MYAVVTSNGKFLYISATVFSLLGFNQEELIGKYLKEIVHKEDVFLIESYFLNEHHMHPVTFRFQRKDGEYTWVETTVDFVENKLANSEKEIILKAVSIECDAEPVEVAIPELQAFLKPEEVKKELQTENVVIFNNIPFPLLIAVKGRIQYVNSALVKLFGAPASQHMLGLTVYDLIDNEFHGIVNSRIQRTQAGQAVGLIEERWRRLNGIPLDVEVKAAPVTFNGKPAEIVLLNDISSRKKFQKILQESRERYQLLIQNSIDTIGVIHKGKWVFINESGVSLFEARDYPDMLGKDVYDFLDQEDQSMTSDTLYKITSGKSKVELLKQSWRSYKNNRIYTETVCIPTSYFGEPAVQVILRDLSDRRRAEELLLQSEKLSVAGQLAAGIAHEIRNPLTAIKGFMQLMQSGHDERKQFYDIVFSELNRIELILSELLMLAKPQENVYKQVDIKNLLHDVSALLETQANLNNIWIRQEYEDCKLLLQCDQNQIKQVFINLLKNAIDAMPAGGNVYLSCKKADGKILVEVKDEGEGIPEELLIKISEPFFTTKEKGTGLGLMITYKIIENHSGSVSVQSKVNEGTIFTVSFPAADGP
ncbi:PAS domain S-box protein [Bacillus lacus]|uniref:histidine kinase n=2 Tax=Metabacillus lacus TaxID=1983721 RepID=A0A7X2LYV7_9BACI|nr:PAS domain S-box protein [Metabacillus lacus]